MKCHIIVLICISQMTNDVEHLFMCLLAVYIVSLEKCLFRYVAHPLVGWFIFFLLNCKSPSYIPGTIYPWASLVAQRLKRLPAMQETWVRSLSWEDPLEKEMATHSSILAWRIPWTEEPCGLQSTGSQRVGHDWATSLSYTLGRHTLWKMFLHSVEFSTILMISFEAQKPLILIFGWTYVSVLSGRYSRVELLGHTSWGTVDVCLWLLCFSCHT